MRSPLRQYLLLTVTIGDFAALRLSLGAFIKLRFIPYHPGLIFQLTFSPLRAALVRQNPLPI
ncbi:MAG TPA: hypothetical protein VGJ48_15270 [Pyrinomonadaceae bacterium]